MNSESIVDVQLIQIRVGNSEGKILESRNRKVQKCRKCEIVKSNNRIIQKSKSSKMQKM